MFRGFKKKRRYPLEIYRWNLLFHRPLARSALESIPVRETSFRWGRKRDLWFRARLALESRSRKMNGASLIPGPLCYLTWINISYETTNFDDAGRVLGNPSRAS